MSDLSVNVGAQTASAERQINFLRASLISTAAAVDTLADSTERATQRSNAFNRQAQKNTTVMSKSQRGLGQLSNGFNILGFQIQDAAIQMQAGTAAMTIFAQQAPAASSALGQIAQGALGATSTLARLAPVIGTFVGVSAALVPAIITMSRVGDAAKDSATELEQFSNSLVLLQSQVKLSSSSLDDLEKKYGALSSRVREATAASLDYLNIQAAEQQQQALKRALDDVSDSLESVRRAYFNLEFGTNQGINIQRRFGELLGITRAEANTLGDALNELTKLSADPLERFNQLEAALQALNLALSSTTDADEQTVKSLSAVAVALTEALQVSARFANEQDAVASAVDGTAAAAADAEGSVGSLTIGVDSASRAVAGLTNELMALLDGLNSLGASTGEAVGLTAQSAARIAALEAGAAVKEVEQLGREQAAVNTAQQEYNRLVREAGLDTAARTPEVREQLRFIREAAEANAAARLELENTLAVEKELTAEARSREAAAARAAAKDSAAAGGGRGAGSNKALTDLARLIEANERAIIAARRTLATEEQIIIEEGARRRIELDNSVRENAINNETLIAAARTSITERTNAELSALRQTEIKEFADSLKSTLGSSLYTFGQQLAESGFKGKEAFADLTKSLISFASQQLINIALQRLLNQLLGAAGGGGLGSVIPGLGGFSAGAGASASAGGVSATMSSPAGVSTGGFSQNFTRASSAANSSTAPSIVINNNAPGVAVDARMTDAEIIEIAVSEATSQSEANFGRSLQTGYGTYSSAIARYTTSGRNVG